MLLSLDPQHLLAARRKAARRVRIDGSVGDWRRVPAMAANDKRNDLLPIYGDSEKGKYIASNDIKSAAFIVDNRHVTFRINLFKKPSGNRKFYYALNILTVDNKLAYALSWTDAGFYLQIHDQSTGKWIKGIREPRGSEFAVRGAVYEGRVPLRLLSKLPRCYFVEAVSWDQKRNSWDNIYFYQQHYRKPAHYFHDALALFIQYAERSQLVPNNPLPLAQAIADGYLYRISDLATKELIVADGLASIAFAAIVSQYSFVGQRGLAELEFQEILVWANRSMLHSLNASRWKLWESFADTGGLLNQEMYRHVSVSPDTLEQAQKLIEEQQLVVEGDLAATLRKIESFLTSIWKYRAELSFIETLYNSDPDYYRTLYDQVKYEFDNDLITIATIYLDPIFKYWNQSASFQIPFIRTNGFFYGNCADTTVIAATLGKALGVPTIHHHYDVIGQNSYFQPVHSFPSYYSSAQNRYIGYSSGSNAVFNFARSGFEGDRVLSYIEVPIVSPLWQIADEPFFETPVHLTSNSCAKIMSLESWQEINENGVSADEVSACLKYQISR